VAAAGSRRGASTRRWRSTASARRPLSTSLTLADSDPPTGTRPYYVRVRQADGEMAWSSPTFVNAE